MPMAFKLATASLCDASGPVENRLLHKMGSNRGNSTSWSVAHQYWVPRGV
jgi:hypothetical protein